MSRTLLYRAENDVLRLDLSKVDSQYEIQIVNGDQIAEQLFDNYDKAIGAYQVLCNAASLTSQMMTKPERNATIILAEMRSMLVHYPTRTQDVLVQFANDVEVQEHRAELRALASQTTMNDSLIRSMCTQLDKEIAAREKVMEQQNYVENDLYGAF